MTLQRQKHLSFIAKVMKHGTIPTERITKNTANGSLLVESYEIASRDVTGVLGLPSEEWKTLRIKC